MDISVLISFRKTLKQTGWSTCYCRHCQQIEAARCDDIVQTVAIWFVPVVRSVVGRTGRCDFCERIIDQWTSPNSVPVESWEPKQGLDSLIARTGAPAVTPIPAPDSTARLDSLFTSVAGACSMNSLDVTFGISTGAILGAIACSITGGILFQTGFRIGELDLFGSVFGSLLAGGVIGAIIGGGLQIIVSRNRVAQRMIQTAYDNYHLDLKRLKEIAQSHPSIVCRAVNRLRDSQQLQVSK
jgi:hypothetical protein